MRTMFATHLLHGILRADRPALQMLRKPTEWKWNLKFCTIKFLETENQKPNWLPSFTHPYLLSLNVVDVSTDQVIVQWQGMECFHCGWTTAVDVIQGVRENASRQLDWHRLWQPPHHRSSLSSHAPQHCLAYDPVSTNSNRALIVCVVVCR